MKRKSIFLKCLIILMFMFTVGLLAFINVRLDTTIQDNNKHMSQIVHAADDDDKDKDKDDDTKDDKIKQSYASKLFDASKSKNQSLMYYKDQTKAGAPTVESTINKEKGNGEAYASFLKAQNKWNLYKTYTSQLDTGTGIIGQIIKWLFGGALLICLYLMDAVDGLIKLIGELIKNLNIFQYMTGDNGNIPKDNPFHILQPVVDVYKGLTTFAKLFIAIALGFVLFMIGLGIGPTRRSKGSYFGRKIGQLLLALVSLALLPLMVSGYLGMIGDLFTSASEDGIAKSSINSEPEKYIVNTRAYIDNSLSAVKGEKNNAALNDGYVLLHEGFPKTDKDVNGKIPSGKFVKYLNTGSYKDDAKDSIEGKALIKEWISSDTMTANDIDSSYDLAGKDGKAWKFWDNDEKRKFTFKLAPGPQSVKTFDGKDIISLDLNDVSIQSASLAGNTGIGVALNGLQLGIVIVSTTVVILTLLFSIFKAIVKAITLFITHIAIAGFAIPQAVLAVLSVAIMLIVSIVTAVMFIVLYPTLAGSISSLIEESINDGLNIGGGVAKQTITTLIIAIEYWLAALVVFKMRGGITSGIEQVFSRIMDRMGMQLGMHPIQGSATSPSSAIHQMANADKSGSSGMEDLANKPIEKGKDKMGQYQDAAIGKGKEAMSAVGNKAKNGLNGLRNDDDGNQSLNGNISSEESVDGEEQGQAIDDSLKNGMDGLGASTERGMRNNLDESDANVGDAIKANDELGQAEQELNDAKQNYDDLKNAGASPEELAQAQKAIDSAQANYDSALGNSQDAAQRMAASGVTAESIANGKQQSANDYAQASSDVQNAQQELNDLKGQRQQLETAGASQEELDNMDNKIANAQEKVNNAQDRQQLAEDAYKSGVGNPEAEKDARNDLLSAQQGVRAAKQQLQNAEQHGNLENGEKTALRNTAQSMNQEMGSLKSNANEQLANAEETKGALNYMSQNGGKAFSDSDKMHQSGLVSEADQSISNIKDQISNAQKSGESKEVKSGLNSRLKEAQQTKANAQTVMSAINSGRASKEAIASQAQVVDNAAGRVSQAEDKLAGLQERENSGQMVSRSDMNQAQQELKSANHSKQQASRILSGLQAQSVAGASASPQKISQLASSNDKKIEDLKGQAAKYEKASNAVNEVASGGRINKQNAAAMLEGQKEAQSIATQRTSAAKNNLDNLQSKLSNLKQQQANGKPVTGDIKRTKASVNQAQQAYEKAQGYENHVKSQGSQIRSAGRKMVENTKAAKENLNEQQELQSSRKSAHNSILKSGGYTREQLQTIQDDISNDRTTLDTNSRQLRNDRKDRLNSIQSKINKSEKIFNTAKQQE